MKDPVENSELLAFTKAVDARSLARAAAELGVPRATVSRRLARLEERLGVRLLRRTSRMLAMTEAGEAFYGHARLILDAVSQAEASVSQSAAEVRGSVRVSVPPMISPSFHAMTCAFARRHPGVRLHVSGIDRLRASDLFSKARRHVASASASSPPRRELSVRRGPRLTPSTVNEERNHQGLDGQLISPPANLNRPGRIVCRERLGGLLRFYDREAA
jgi:DNA-binding transcriptional LysR family regulator